MKKLFVLIVVAAGLPWVGACTKSVDRAQRDVDRERREASQEVAREQRKLNDEQRAAEERVARQERRVQDEVREGQREITREQRELQDAQRAEIRRDDARRDTTPDITPLTPAPLPPE
jgi:hypothetical protein